MTIQELKDALLQKRYTAPIRLGAHAVIVEDVDKFLKVQFIECDNWKKDLDKCPAYERLMKFYEVVHAEDDVVADAG